MQRLPQRLLSALTLLTLPFLFSCGSGSGGPIAVCDLDSFTPSYARQVSHLLNWPDFPVRVFFLRDSNYTVTRQTRALAGFDAWVTATGSTLSYSVVTSQSNANVTVRFDPTTANGLTTIHFSGLTISLAEIVLGVKDLALDDVECVAAHEFGHALGIDGHSDHAGDLMYAVHFIGQDCPITTRDLNTMKTGYCSLFGRAAGIPCTREAAPAGPQQTITIE